MQGSMLVNGKKVDGRTLTIGENGLVVEDENDVVYTEKPNNVKEVKKVKNNIDMKSFLVGVLVGSIITFVNNAVRLKGKG